ncbi:putative ribonuclease H-like domain-containing protein [Tanacetum coccineum]
MATDPPYSQDPKSSHDDRFKPSSDDGKKVDEDQRKDSECIDQEKEDYVNSTNIVNAARANEVNVVGEKSSIELLVDPNIPKLEDYSIFEDNENIGAEADMNNLDTTIQVSPNPTTRIHKDHPLDQVIEDLQSATQTRRMSKNLEEHGFAMQEELLQFKLQEAWTLVDLPNGKRAICTKWVFRNKKDERGIVIRNKARLVTQEYTQEERIDYDEVFTPVARIEAIRLFLAYASFKDFMVYQIDVKSAFIYVKIKEEVYVCQPPRFEYPDFPDRVYRVEKSPYGLHQAPRAWYETLSTYLLNKWFKRGKINKTLFIRRHKGLQLEQENDGIFISQDKYVGEVLKKFRFIKVKIASTPIETQKPLLKDEDGEEVDVYMYRSMIGLLMYLTSSRLDIMFAVCACAKYQVNPKVSHLHAMKRIFRYLKGQPKLGLWYLKDSPFALVAYTNSDYARASLDRKSTIGEKAKKSDRLIMEKMVIRENRQSDLVRKRIERIESEGFEQIAKTDNGEVQLQALVDWKKIIITELIVRRDLQLEDVKGVDCLPNATIFEQLTLMGSKTTAWNEFSSTMASTIICLATNQKFNFSKYIFESMVKNLENVYGKFLMYPSGPTDNVADEAVYEEMDDSLERAATTATSLDAEQDRGNINKTQSKATPNEPSSLGTSSGGGPRCQETIGDTIAQTGFENVSKHSNDPLLARGSTLRSGKVSLKLQELMELCITLQLRVLALETTKTTQAMEITSLKRRVKKLEKRNKSRSHRLKRLYKVGSSRRVEYYNEEGLGKEDASKQGRIDDINDDAGITLDSTHFNVDTDMFGVHDLDGNEVIVDNEDVVTTAEETRSMVKEVTAVTIPVKLKSAKPKANKVVIQEPEQGTTTPTLTTTTTELKSLLFMNRSKLAREKAQLVEEANIAWDDVQAKIEAAYQLAQRLQAQEQKELTDEEKARLTKLVEESSKKAEVEIAHTSSLKRAGEELEQESSKKQKLEEDKESEMFGNNSR